MIRLDLVKRLGGVVFVLMVFCFSSSVPLAATRGIGVVAAVGGNGASAERVHLYDRTTAVVIGIDRYRNLNPSAYLKYPVKDARGVARMFKDNYGFDRVIELYNEQATRAEIMKVLQGDLSTTGVEDGVVIYFAGHGITRSTAQGDLGYLIPYDGSLRADEMYKNISMQQFKSDISPLIPAKHLLFIADACFGGLLLATRSTSVKPSRQASYLREITREPVRQIITAGGKNQTVLDGGKDGHSVFTGRLLAALAGVRDYITVRELGLKLQQQVFGDAAARGHEQKPLFGEIYGTGDFVFVPDFRKRVEEAEHQVEQLEQEINDLKAHQAAAKKYRQEAKQREMERQRLRKEAELELARLRKEAARRATRLQAEAAAASVRAAEAARQDLAQQKELEAKRLARLANLKAQAEKMRREAVKVGSDIGFKAARAEVKKINQRLKEIDREVKAEKEAQLVPLREYYQKRLAAVQTAAVAPRDKMFETEADYRARKQQAESAAESRRDVLRNEQRRREAEIEQEFAKLLTIRRQRFLDQRKKLTTKMYELGPPEVSFRLEKYDPYRQMFTVEFFLNDCIVYRLVKVKKEQARQYWQTPTLLLPSVTMKINKNAVATVVEGVLLTPENEKLVAFIWKFTEPVTGMEFVWVPGGCFQMGSDNGDNDEKPVRKVSVDGFWLGKYEVTQGQWQKIMGSNPSYFKNGNDYPVEKVSWHDCQEFIRNLNSKSDRHFRLTTEAEWEYAARSGGQDEKYAGGNDVEGVAWYAGNSGSSTHPVGRKAANGLGLYDMSGNVWEWCADWHSDHCICRGGSWGTGPWHVRSTERGGRLRPSVRSMCLGFRLVSLER